MAGAFKAGKCRTAWAGLAPGGRMATIIAFKTAPKPTTASVLAAYGAGQSAEIVLFPGVRYERHGEERASKPKKPRRNTRDTLDLDTEKNS